tara:strand:- start:533 stop:1267 length:735 start_codon:yes stop_codon:yes gene_type:complete
MINSSLLYLNQNSSNKKETLSAIKFYKEGTNNSLIQALEIVNASNILKKSKSQSIFLNNNYSNKFYLIKKGVVNLSRVCESGKELTLNLLKENEIFGITPFLNKNNICRYSAYAFTDVEIICIPMNNLINLIETNKYIRKEVIKGFTNIILQSEYKIETLNDTSKISKLISFLLFCSNKFGLRDEKGLKINLELTHKSISNSIGSSRLTITRQLTKLKEAGLISIENKNIIITNLKELKKVPIN